MSRLRILTLGWEFPPLINGGLGVACFGLSKALAKHVDLEVIVPQSDPSAGYDGFALRGVNNLDVVDLVSAEERYSYESFAQVSRIPTRLDPYADEATILEKLSPGSSQWLTFSQTTAAQLDMFRMGTLYGEDLGVKVVEFSKIAAKLAMQRDFDIVHAHDWMTYLAGVEVKKATGKPLVVHVHASQYDRAGAHARGWIYDLEKYGMEEADCVIPVSHYTGKVVTGHYLIDPAKVHPIHNGADPVASYTTTKKFPEKLVLFLGRLTAQKGPEYFVEIASKVATMYSDVRFVMAGSGEKLKQLIESGAYRGLGGKFHFTGFLDMDKVHELLSMTDVYCMPSVSEPFGLSALEAAQFRIPAVISRQSGVSEVLKGALKADFWDTDLMAKYIVDLLTDDQLRERVLDQGSKDVAAATWD
ncbi:MAG: glycosyltransferase family 4 protein, partial [Akkermansiaceae bacterium]|nr:glycosyltransferase family 4 protein [Akkermansiaceae bacterium]